MINIQQMLTGMSTTQVLAQNHASLSSYKQLNLHVYKDFQFLLKKVL